MEESHREGLTIHPDPESCATVRKGGGEALTGARLGEVLSRESCLDSGAPTLSIKTEGEMECAAIVRRISAPRGRRPSARTEPPYTVTGRSYVQLRKVTQFASESLRT